ncbi:MAG: hypothetical protein ACTSPU_01345 [Promethearchaeota archaeon]
MSKTNEEVLEKAFALGKKYEQECTGCAQTVIGNVAKLATKIILRNGFKPTD